MGSLTSPRASLHGATAPRVELVPPHAYSLGVEACELARMAGLVLDEWQRRALEVMLAAREDGQWACFEYGEIVARQNGKGAILEARALAALFLLGERLILWSAHEYKTAMEAFLRMRQLVATLEREQLIDAAALKTHNTNGEEGFERLDTGQRLKFIARSKSSGRGFSGDVNIIDEAFAYQRSMQEALMPTMNARPNPQIIYTSSPPLDSWSGEPLHALRARADEGDESLGWRDWGLAGSLDRLDAIDLDDRALWAATNPALGIRMGEETLLRNRRSMSDAGFAREILGIWPRPAAEGGGEIDARTWRGLADESSRRVGDVALGVDIAPHRGYAAIAVYGVRGDGLGHMQLSDHRPGTRWVVGRLLELVKHLDPVGVAMGRGTGESLRAELAEVGLTEPDDPDRPQRRDVVITRPADMAAATSQLIDAVAGEEDRHLGQEELDAAVVGARTRRAGDSVAWLITEGGADMTPLVSVTLARWLWLARNGLVDAGDAPPTIW